MLVVRWLSRAFNLLSFAALCGVASLFATTPSTSSQDFGTVIVNPATPVTTTLSYQVSGLSSAPSFSLQYGIDFSLGAVNCVGIVTATCSLPVGFAPKSPGLRQDAVHVLDNNGSLLATIILHGIGSGPQIFVWPGLISTFATGALGNPQGLVVDSAGNLYISDSLNQVVLRVSAVTKVTTTVAGSGVPGRLGDGGLATRANLNTPSGITVDAAGNLYIADTENNRVRRVDAISGIITTVAGNGGLTLGDGGPAVSASLSSPSDVAVDTAGNLFIADAGNNRIREVDLSGTIKTVAGGGTPAPGTDGIGNGGLATNAILAHASGIALDSAGNLYIADTSNHLIRKVSNGMISVVAGTGAPAYGGDGGLATNASLNEPNSVRVDAAGGIYIADLNNNAIREVNAAGIISTIAGLGTQFGSSGSGGPSNTLVLRQPSSVAFDAAGNVYIADQGNMVVRWITPWSGSLTFPATNIGQVSTPQVVSIANTGNQLLNFSAFGMNGSFVQQSSGGPDCSLLSPLLPGTSCAVAVAFAPQAVGTLTGSLAFTATSAKVLGLTGTGAGTPGSGPTVNATSLNFSNQAVGVPSTAQVVTVLNPGSTALPLAASISGSNATEFAIAQTCVTLSSHGSCNVSISFTPAGSGLRTATLTLVEGSGASGSQTVFLTGTGTASQSVISPATLSFSNQGPGSLPVTQTFAFSNPSSATVDVSSIALSGPSDFSLSSTCQVTLPGNSTCTISVTFAPTVAGAESATLVVTGYAGGAISQSAAITTSNPVLTFVASTSNLGAQTRGTTSLPIPILLRNLGGVAIIPSSIMVTGTYASDFSQVNNCSVVAAGQGCTIWVTYSPTGNSPATSTASLMVSDNAPGSPHSIPISGTATGLSQALIQADSPSTTGSVSGTISIGGWAISANESITSVNLAVDGVPVSPAVYGISRPDVCAVYSGRAGCPNVGWSSSIVTTRFADGAHQLQITAASAQTNTTVSIPFNISNLTSSAAKATRFNIDQPNGSATPLSGTSLLSGWAIDDKTAISNISISVDGVPKQSATYGVSRPDVCAVYSGRAGCPNVGWSALLDTTQLPDGTHVLALTAQTTDSRYSTMTSTFTVANGSTNPIRVNIESPGSAAATGILQASGWAIDPSASISSASLLIDGVSQGAAVTMSRPDVCLFFSNPPGCPNVGWTGTIDTTLLSDGPHKLSVLVTSADSHHVVATKPFTVSNLRNPNSNTTIASIDAPSSGSVLSGRVTVSGWAGDQVSGIASVVLSVDGVPFRRVQDSSSRPDVCAIFPALVDCPNPGWQAAMDTTLLADGRHTLAIAVTSRQGKTVTRTTTFTSSNGDLRTTNGEMIIIDAPTVATPVSGQVTVSGWATNKAQTVQSILINLDGIMVGMAQYGLSRPDVCVYFSSPFNCPNVGWSYSLDTRSFSNGFHTLQAIGQSGSVNFERSESILVSNITPSTRGNIDSPTSDGQYSGIVQMSGWTIDDADSIANVKVSVDGLPLGPAMYGNSRADVCSVFPNRGGCPNVGWTYSLNTIMFQNGIHIFAVTATTRGGLESTRSTVFSVAN